MKHLILLVAFSMIGMSMAIPDRERRSLIGLGLGHDGGVLLPGGVWGWGPGAVVSVPVVPPVGMVGPHSGPSAVVGPSAGGAIVAGPSGTIIAPEPGLLGLGLGHHGLW